MNCFGLGWVGANYHTLLYDSWILYEFLMYCCLCSIIIVCSDVSSRLTSVLLSRKYTSDKGKRRIHRGLGRANYQERKDGKVGIAKEGNWVLEDGWGMEMSTTMMAIS